MSTRFFQYEFQSELSPHDRQLIEDALGMRVTGVRDEWKDTPGLAQLDGGARLYLERTASEGTWWFTLSGPATLPPQRLAQVQGDVESVLERISSSWRIVQG